MPWTETTRADYLRKGLRYASDMTDAEWRLIARRLPPRRRLGRPREVDLRKVVEAILFILSTGCQWRALPREFPPYSTVSGPGVGTEPRQPQTIAFTQPPRGVGTLPLEHLHGRATVSR